MPLPIHRRSSRLSRSEPVREERNILRGHALFVRFLERRGLGQCVLCFPEDMTLGLLRAMTSHDLQHYYGIQGNLQDRLIKVIEESRGEDHSDLEVSDDILLLL